MRRGEKDLENTRDTSLPSLVCNTFVSPPLFLMVPPPPSIMSSSIILFYSLCCCKSSCSREVCVWMYYFRLEDEEGGFFFFFRQTDWIHIHTFGSISTWKNIPSCLWIQPPPCYSSPVGLHRGNSRKISHLCFYLWRRKKESKTFYSPLFFSSWEKN